MNLDSLLNLYSKPRRANIEELKISAKTALQTADALELLKQLEPTEPIWHVFWHLCGNCGQLVEHSDFYCRNCGRKIKWSKVKFDGKND